MSMGRNGASATGQGSGLTGGVVIGVVTDLNDPDGEGKIKVTFPWLDKDDEKSSAWAPVAAAFGGANRGAFFAPEKNDEALVCFEHGDFSHPFIVGFLWNGADKPPTDDPRMRMIRSLNGHEMCMHDPDVVQGDPGFICLKAATGDEVRLSNTGISITSRSSVVIDAPSLVLNGRPVVTMPRPV